MIRYLHLDSGWRTLARYLRYRRACIRCFLRGPRLGHEWEGKTLVSQCTVCPKRWIGNL